MAEDHLRTDTELAQQTLLLDDPEFLQRIVHAALQQEVLEAEMTQHVGAAPYERNEKALVLALMEMYM